MPRIHNTSQGEMWDMISLLYYDSEMYMDKLITANISFRNIVVFPANCKIVIPDLENKKTVAFPPWRNK